MTLWSRAVKFRKVTYVQDGRGSRVQHYAQCQGGGPSTSNFGVATSPNRASKLCRVATLDEELLFTGSAKPLDLWASGRIVTPTPYYAHTGWPMLPRDLFALTNLLDFYTERVLCCCWLADKKDIRPVKNLAPSVPKGCLGDFSWPGLIWSGLHKTGRLIGQTTETVIYSTHNETAVRKHLSSTTNNNKTVLFFYQFWPCRLCRLIVLLYIVCILCVYILHIVYCTFVGLYWFT